MLSNSDNNYRTLMCSKILLVIKRNKTSCFKKGKLSSYFNIFNEKENVIAF